MEAQKGFMRLLNIMSRDSSTIYNSLVEQEGILRWKHPYIMLITRNPGVSQEEIARELLVNPSTVTRQIATLEREGLIEKRHDTEDRRAVRIYPTERMQELRPVTASAMGSLNDVLMRGFSDEEALLAKEFLGRMKDNLDEEARRILDK